MNYAVLKGASYALAHAPDMVMHNGTTQSVERTVNPNSSYLSEVKKYLRSFEQAVNYGPNQAYIGNLHPDELRGEPNFEAKTDGKFGRIINEADFIFLMKLADSFDLVWLEKSFMAERQADYLAGELSYRSKGEVEAELVKVKEGSPLSEIEALIKNEGAEGLYVHEKLVGCIKKAHDVDINLNAHTIFENLAAKASAVLAVKEYLKKYKLDPKIIDLVIECSEEACGDMNQRGGGNFAKAIAEVAGLSNATGFDIRGFCAAPTHALVTAASLVQGGAYGHVLVVAGGATAKLGMNGKSNVAKQLPIVEDVIGAFAALVGPNDGQHPIIRTDLLGKHKVATGSAPQAVMTALISEPLAKAGLKVTDIDKYSVEMQDPNATKPAGAGDVPEGNYKMIAAIGVKIGDLTREEMPAFILKHGMPGFAPTQGHIPSGVPYLGFAVEDILSGKIKRTMIVGKGSLFLGRMTNLFDGISVIIEKNPGDTTHQAGAITKEEINQYLANALRDFANSL
ncbi:MAG: glycine/sarcosine/betaine reductase complex component C subunit beta, partial [Spirochaetaceae bacterium]|nr:glycine/sarcosine/betaine reductase complex component C subunit beta [Spirochaetaceae bacterium]